MGCFSSEKAHCTWKLTSKGTEPSVSASGSMGFWRYSVCFGLQIWQLFYYNSLKRFLMTFSAHLIKYYCHRLITSYLLVIVENFRISRSKTGSILSPAFNLKQELNNDSISHLLPIFFMREISKGKIPFLRKNKLSISLFNITVILDKFREIISSVMALLPPAVFEWPFCYKAVTFICTSWTSKAHP